MRRDSGMTRRIVWIAIALAALSGLAQAADHRDGPRIAQNTTTLGNIDINDVYIFRAPHGADRTAMIMTLSAAAGVVGPAHFLPGAVYEFRIDNTGDAVSDVIFQVVFSAPLPAQASTGFQSAARLASICFPRSAIRASSSLA